MGLSDQIRNYLATISLQDLLQRRSVRVVAERQDRHTAGQPVEIGLRSDQHAFDRSG
jgi:Rrf2 family iron-sulfur cluster assembly transcriptional regulator